MAIRVITQRLNGVETLGDASVEAPIAGMGNQPLSAAEWFMLSVAAGLTVSFLSRLLFKKG